MNPYLSIVVTTRNDDHGGGLNRRTQIFIDGVASQARRFRLETELVLVEWNPPADRPPLRDAFRWPIDNPWCEVRIVTVAAEQHARYRYGDRLPLLQMIAKNAGVRRARGEFVLSTNVDILFSDELFSFIAGRRLEHDVVYRCDRVDVDRHVPLNVPIERQLAHCRNTVLRIARNGGMWVVPSDAPARSVEFAREVPYVPPVLPPRPPPRTPFRALRAKVARAAAFGTDRANGSLAKRFLASAARLRRRAAASIRYRSVRLRAYLQATADRSQVDGNFLSRRASYWANEVFVVLGVAVASVLVATRSLTYRAIGWLKRARARASASFVGHYARRARAYATSAGQARHRLQVMGYRPSPSELLDELLVQRRSRAIPQLHTHACGDFILTHRGSWSRMRGSPELVMYSMHLDSLTIMTAYKLGMKIEELPRAMVHYHIEHGNGWTPEHELSLYRRMNERGVRILTYGQYLRYATYLLHLPHHFLSDEDWGLAAVKLPEEVIASRAPSHSTHADPPSIQLTA